MGNPNGKSSKTIVHGNLETCAAKILISRLLAKEELHTLKRLNISSSKKDSHEFDSDFSVSSEVL
jgi:hypothetical protein